MRAYPKKTTVFDESGTHLDMASRYARAPRGERAYTVGRRNMGKNMTLLAGITLEGMTAPFVVGLFKKVLILENFPHQRGENDSSYTRVGHK